MAVTDWLLRQHERGNPYSRLDDHHLGDTAWSTGNQVRPLVHGATYFAELLERLDATVEGDLVFFTDWQGDADERLDGTPGSEVADVLARADERGVDVRGLVWRSHSLAVGFTAGENLRLGQVLQSRGAEALLDMRVRHGGSHHQKLLVIRHHDDSSRDVAYVGGIDLCHSRRDDRDHQGDPQALVTMAEEYGDTPPWHDIQAAITGPAVHDVETVFRERWEDPTPLTRSPLFWLRDRVLGLDVSPDPLPEQAPPPPAPAGATHAVQLLLTYPDLRLGRDYPFARGGERSVARGYSKALGRARTLVYLEDQYLWGRHIGDAFTQALREQPDLHVLAVVPLHPDLAGAARVPELLGRRRAMEEMHRAAPDRVAVFGIENHAGTPVYVHAKCCIIDDTWATIGSDNLNRRSWTHDSELSAVVVDTDPEDPGGFARSLRLGLAAEHLDRDEDDADAMADCVDPIGMFHAFDRSAERLDAWHDGGRVGERPPGRLRRLEVPEVPARHRPWALPAYLTMHDPDGRPRSRRRRDDF
ncbi:phospholipase D [Nocardioides psychrotolerans]|uniref:Phosphatidylserine/phosphatidylglycerophosphate/cardiolipin synthase n=1 Tax=Nocardioides psychrotolerans TaxID=1005945 RepID=A0A1I3JEL7_9ACTN|nr:phospholipase D-like domain-containing protein [Nocardioides psychrotolerans]GEP38178.1 phospholipase D [Nocardioides psychrotolerans]SFI58717.1 Phosphatidylserine/phosphatidylglycerophosphate/cardiolipin synthase [Nocardioides psychrotolerans]